MANIDAKRTIRTFKDFSLELSANGGGSGVETIVLLGNTLLTERQYSDIVDKKLIAVTGEDKQVILSGWDEETGEYPILSSTIYDGKYTLVEIGENTDQSTSEEFPFKVQSIQEVSVGGGAGLFTVHLTRGENEWLEQDKTNDEILQAVYTNGVVCCIYELSDGGGVNNALILKAFYNTRKEMYYFDMIVGNELVEHVYFNETHFYVSEGDE